MFSCRVLILFWWCMWQKPFLEDLLSAFFKVIRSKMDFLKWHLFLFLENLNPSSNNYTCFSVLLMIFGFFRGWDTLNRSIVELNYSFYWVYLFWKRIFGIEWLDTNNKSLPESIEYIMIVPNKIIFFLIDFHKNIFGGTKYFLLSLCVIFIECYIRKKF